VDPVAGPVIVGWTATAWCGAGPPCGGRVDTRGRWIAGEAMNSPNSEARRAGPGGFTGRAFDRVVHRPRKGPVAPIGETVNRTGQAPQQSAR